MLLNLSEAREISQSVKSLPCKHEDLTSVPQTYNTHTQREGDGAGEGEEWLALVT